MINVDINLGKACNNKCVFCSNGQTTTDERRWAKVDQIETELSARRSEGAESVGLLGGEPTLYPHLGRLIRKANQLGYSRISIITNGSRLSEPGFLNSLLEAGLSRVALSIHSHRAALEDAITRRKGSFAEKIRALENLVQAQRSERLKDGLSLNTVLHRKNAEQLDRFVDFMEKIGVRDIRFNFIRPTFKAEGSEAWVPRFKLVTPLVRRLIARNEQQRRMFLNFADFPLCKLPWEVLASPELRKRYVGESWDMVTDVTEMRRRPMPDAPNNTTIRFNWKSKRMEFKTFLPVCSTCVLSEQCEGVWQAYLDIYGEREFDVGPAVAEACLASN